jgi:hypothetical protein
MSWIGDIGLVLKILIVFLIIGGILGILLCGLYIWKIGRKIVTRRVEQLEVELDKW